MASRASVLIGLCLQDIWIEFNPNVQPLDFMQVKELSQELMQVCFGRSEMHILILLLLCFVFTSLRANGILTSHDICARVCVVCVCVCARVCVRVCVAGCVCLHWFVVSQSPRKMAATLLLLGL